MVKEVATKLVGTDPELYIFGHESVRSTTLPRCVSSLSSAALDGTSRHAREHWRSAAGDPTYSLGVWENQSILEISPG